MLSFFEQLFDTGDFPPRWSCGHWSEAHGWLHILSDIGIFGAYFAIPVVLASFVVRRKDVPFLPVFWLFAAFILCCGIGHLIEATIFWQPWYRLSGLVKFLTAVVSWATVFALIPIVPRALSLPALAAINERLKHEIEERTEAEQRLRQSEEGFRLMVQSLQDYAIMRLDSEGRVTSWNVGAQRLIGFRADEIIGQHCSRFYCDADVQSGKPDMELRVAAEKGHCEDEGWRVRKDGSRFWANVISTALRDPAGRLLGFVKVITDITERKQAEEALREKADRLRLAQQAGRIGSFEWNVKTGTNIWSPELEAMYGLPMGGFARTQPAWENLVHPDDRAKAVGHTKRAFETGQPTEGEWRVVWPDGSVHWVFGCFQVFKDDAGQPVRLIGVNIDITERKQAENALRESEQRFIRFMQHLPGLAWIKDLHGRYVYANDAAAKAFRRSVAELRGRTDEEIFPPQTAAKFAEGDRKALASGTGVLLIETLEHEDGVHHSIVSKFPILDVDGQVALVGGVAFDITDRIHAEEKLKQQEETIRMLNTDLEQRVRDRTSELESANKELEAFSYSVSHDLRAPLRAIDGFSRIVLKKHAEELTAQGREYLQLVRDNTQQMGQLVDDLLSFSRLSRQPISKQTTDSSKIVRQCLDDMRGEQQGRHVEVSIGELIHCQAEPALLKQVWMNLLANALKFTRKKEIAKIEIGCQKRDDGDLTYYVKDNGVGFNMQPSQYEFSCCKSCNNRAVE